MGELTRAERLQVMLSDDELAALDQWRFNRHMPSRAAAIRELLKRGLLAEGFSTANRSSRSKDYGVIEEAGKPNGRKSRNGASGASERK
jgi:metal-responsive CopG/Arc/MetJ family transcriptional regulator